MKIKNPNMTNMTNMTEGINNNQYTNQTIFAIRVIGTYFTFYKAIIPAEYWKEFEKGLPQKNSVIVTRYPEINGKQTGLDIAEPLIDKRFYWLYHKFIKFYV
jgi:hypothetical protein